MKNNKNIFFTDRLVDDIAIATEKFSFAYLKEALSVGSSLPRCKAINFTCGVSSLVELAGLDGDDPEKPTFEQLVHNQIKALRKELELSASFKHEKSAQRDDLSLTSSSKQATRPNSDCLQSVLDIISTSVSSSRGKSRIFLDAPISTCEKNATSGSYGGYISPLQESEWLQNMRTRVNRLKVWGDQ